MSEYCGLTILHANRMEALREVVFGWIQQHPLAHPLSNEVILTHSHGMAHWLKLELAHQHRIAAALSFKLPSEFLWHSYRTVLGKEDVPLQSAFDKKQLQWHLYRHLPDWIKQQPNDFAALARFLEYDADGRKRYQLALQLADLFDQYQVYRADWLTDWSEEQYQLRLSNGHIMPLTCSQHWQVKLWLKLNQTLLEQINTHRAAIHPKFLSTLESLSQRPVGLPERIIVFGISSLPAQVVEALHALSQHCHVIMAVLNPCRHYWADILEVRDVLQRAGRRRHAKRSGMPELLNDPELLHLHGHPLLAAWGRQGRDFIALLDQYDEQAYSAQQKILFSKIDLFDDTEPSEHASLLEKLQWSIVDLEPPASTPNILSQLDESIVFHSAHSPLREVEILHDQLLDRFEKSHGRLKPSDVMVMVPDIDLYAPFVQSVFRQTIVNTEDKSFQIPFNLADRADRSTAPVLRVIEALLHLPEQRLQVSELLDWLDIPEFAQAFAIESHELPLLRRWVEGAGIRWGLDGEHKTRLQLPSEPQNSWLFGLQRMLLGYAVEEEGAWSDIYPYPEIGGLEAELVGKLAHCLRALSDHSQALTEAYSPQQWQEQLGRLLQDCIVAEDEFTQALLEKFTQSVTDWVIACDQAGIDHPIPLAVVREVVLEGFTDTSVALQFMSGFVTFGTLMPMRAIPFKLICLLGMNDGDYPRQTQRIDFDLMAQDYRPGDRSRHEDDRYLLLEAVLSAREALYISYVGQDSRDNRRRPPSVLISQLQNYLDRQWQLESEPNHRLSTLLTTEHPLQPFSLRYFQGQTVWTYAAHWEGVHLTPAEQSFPESGQLTAYTPPDSMPIQELAYFFKKPVAAFFSQRLQIYFRDSEAPLDCEAFALDGLDLYQLRSRALNTLLRQADSLTEYELAMRWEDFCKQLRGEGLLPVGKVAEADLEVLKADLWCGFSLWQQAAEQWPEEIEEVASLSLTVQPDDTPAWKLHADIKHRRTGLNQQQALFHVLPNTLFQGKEQTPRLDTIALYWPLHLLASAKGLPLSTVLISPKDKCYLVWPPLSAGEAQQALQQLATLWCQAMRQPLPVAIRTATVYLSVAATDDNGEKRQKRAKDEYEGGFNQTGEVERDAALARAWPNWSALFAAGFEHYANEFYGLCYATSVAAACYPLIDDKFE